MRRFLLGLSIIVLLGSPAFSLTLEEAEASIQADKTLDPAEATRQIAGLYRLSGQVKESFEILQKSLEKGIFNDWMLEDFSALGTSLRRENVVRANADKLLKAKDLQAQLGGLLLKSLTDLRRAPEQVLESLREFSHSHTGKEANGLFLLLLQRSYNALGNAERSQFFGNIMEENFPDYYVLRKAPKTTVIPVSKNPATPSTTKPAVANTPIKTEGTTILQVGSFKTDKQGGVESFKNRLKRLGFAPDEEISGDILRIRVSTTKPEESIRILKKEGIPFYIVQGDPLLTGVESMTPSTNTASFSASLPKSTIQVGIFSSVDSANKHKDSLAKDGFTETRVIWQEDNRLFYVFLQSPEPEITLKALKDKGYDAFIKNLE